MNGLLSPSIFEPSAPIVSWVSRIGCSGIDCPRRRWHCTTLRAPRAPADQGSPRTTSCLGRYRVVTRGSSGPYLTGLRIDSVNLLHSSSAERGSRHPQKILSAYWSTLSTTLLRLVSALRVALMPPDIWRVVASPESMLLKSSARLESVSRDLFHCAAISCGGVNDCN